MEKMNVRTDKALMSSVENEDVSHLNKIKRCNEYHFKEPGVTPDPKNHSSGSTGSVFDCDAN